MSRIRTYRYVHFLVVLWIAIPALGEVPWQAVSVKTDAECVHLAVVDLQRYIGQVTGAVPKIGVVEGETAGVELQVDPGTKEALGKQGYRIEQAAAQVRVTGATPEGLVNGIYGLLRELGFRFYLGSESIPEKLPESLPISPVVRKPALQVRGVLPWYNFFNSPTAWDLVDHRAFVDQLIRGGANFLGFHSYDSEPFAGYFENGDVRWGSRLLNTATPTWGTAPLKTQDFAYGTGELFADDYFGAATTQLPVSNAEAVRAEQEVMRQALDYAHRRGLIACLGFELNGDPTNPEMRDAFLKRLNHVLDTYPTLDLIWLWQSETQGVQGFTPQYAQHILPYGLSEESPLQFYGLARRETFKRVVEEVRGEGAFYRDDEAGKMARANEGARLELWSNLALRALRQREKAPRIGISGWGGDERLLSADYYEGLDKLLPQDVVFTSLDHIAPRERVDTVYHRLPPTRERWPIPWMENDGDQWRPQPYVHIYEKMMRDLLQGDSQGVLGIHWRTRDIEENFNYMMDFAWNPELTAEGFFQDIARHGFPPDIAEAMGGILYELDKLGYSWVGGAGQTECGGFSWGGPDPAKLPEFERVHARAKELLFSHRHESERARWLLASMDWVSNYAQLQQAAADSTRLVEQAHKADGTERKALAEKALQTLAQGGLPNALWAYARRISTRGEYGVLATMNTKMVVAWRALRNEAASLAGVAISEDLDFKQEPFIRLPRFLGTVPDGQDLELLPVVIGGPAWMHCRPLGGAWQTTALAPMRGYVFRSVVPAAQVQAPGLEIGFSFSQDPDAPMACGPVGVTVQAIPNPENAPLPKKVAASPPPRITLSAKPGLSTLAEVRWDDVADADYFRVYRNEKLAVETAVPFFPDCPTESENTYRVEAMCGGQVIAASEPAALDLKGAAVPAPGAVRQLSTGLNRKNVLLYWESPATPFTAKYRVERSSDGNAWQSVAEVPYRLGRRSSFRDTPKPGVWFYRVTPTGPTGLNGASAQAQVNFAPSDGSLQPSSDWPLTEAPKGGLVRGNMTFSNEGAAFAGGHIEFPDDPRLDLEQGMTIHFEFRMDRRADMPVLLCHGSWQQDGWFAQILGGRLLVRMLGGDGEGPAIELGKWYDVDFVFDGVFARMRVNGEWIGQGSGPLQPGPARQPLILGTYEADSIQYQFPGTIRNVKIYNDVAVDLPAE